MTQPDNMPRHIAIVMDGNGRWATKRLMPRIMGHRAGAKAVRRAVDYCVLHNVEVLSLFALSVENFLSRPVAEVQFLLSLLFNALKDNIDDLNKKNIRIRVIGDLAVLDPSFAQLIQEAEAVSRNNTGLILVVAVHYSGRWDIAQAAKRFAQHAIDHQLDVQACSENDFSQFLCIADLPSPDLLIRTSGEQRISNFMLWQLAYTELFFTEALWPDFDDQLFDEAIAAFQKRERRFGLTGAQLRDASC